MRFSSITCIVFTLLASVLLVFFLTHILNFQDFFCLCVFLFYCLYFSVQVLKRFIHLPYFFFFAFLAFFKGFIDFFWLIAYLFLNFFKGIFYLLLKCLYNLYKVFFKIIFFCFICIGMGSVIVDPCVLVVPYCSLFCLMYFYTATYPSGFEVIRY